MYYVEILKQLNDDEIDKFIKDRIEMLEEEAKELNEDYDIIGYNIGYNYDKGDYNEDGEPNINLHCIYNGYVPKGVRVVFGLCYNRGFLSNDGKYYYVDDDDYIRSFVKYINEFDVENEYELFDSILTFLLVYFGDYQKFTNKNKVSREEMFQMLYKNKCDYYKPVKEHGLSWFKGKGNALCSEYAIISNNIMNFLGIDSYIVFGNISDMKNRMAGHAYNIVSFDEKETDNHVDMLLDYCNYVNVYDSRFNIIGSAPFMENIDNLNEELMDEMVNNKKHLEYDDYSLIIFADKLISITKEDVKRDYYIDGNVVLRNEYEKNNTYYKKR